MKIFASTISIAVLFSILLTPKSSQAYRTTTQSARALDHTTALFTITYHFGFLNRELYMPIMAKRTNAVSATSTDTLFTLLDQSGSSTPIGLMNGLVLSNATIKDGQYYLPAGKAADFTLVAAVTVPMSSSSANYALKITSLPFTMVDDGTKIAGALNPSELKYYVTPKIELNDTRVPHSLQIISVTRTNVPTTK